VILDEPTNDLDMATLAALEEMLSEFGGSALVVTHDRWFLDRVATTILAFEDDGRVVRYAGNHASYRLQKAAAAESAAAAPPPRDVKPKVAPPAAPAAQASKPKALTYAERIELDGILDRIEAAEGAVAAAEQELADPKLYAERGSEVATITQRLERAKAELATIVGRWEDLERRKEAAKA
jgi:ATP-binding cassette subfamily F protein uup